jgi:hypothetical protein
MLGAKATVVTIMIAMGSASREAPMRVLVVVNGERERQLATRIEGQTADLPVSIAITEVDPDLDREQLAAAARSEAQAHSAEVAVWLVGEGGGWLVNVAHGDRTFRRSVGEPTGALSSSASIEAAALVVRTVLRGLAAGEEVPEVPPPSPPPTPLRFEGALAWTAVLDHPGSTGHHGVELRAGAAFGPWSFLLAVEEHPSQTIAAEEATIRLERQAAALLVGYDAQFASRWRLGGDLGVELFRLSRVTTAAAEGFVATPPKDSWSPALRPELHLGFRLVWNLWVSFHLGLDAFLSRPEFSIEGAAGTRTIAGLFWVQPRASLGLAVDLE